MKFADGLGLGSERERVIKDAVSASYCYVTNHPMLGGLK